MTITSIVGNQAYSTVFLQKGMMSFSLRNYQDRKMMKK